MVLKTAGGVVTKPIEPCMDYSAIPCSRGGIKQKNVHDLVLVGRFDLNPKSAIHDPVLQR